MYANVGTARQHTGRAETRQNTAWREHQAVTFRLGAGLATLLHDSLVRSEGLEPPRCYSLPPQGSASTNSATSAWDTGWNLEARRIDGADVTNRGCRDKQIGERINYLTPGDFGSICLTSTAIR